MIAIIKKIGGKNKAVIMHGHQYFVIENSEETPDWYVKTFNEVLEKHNKDELIDPNNCSHMVSGYCTA